MIVRPRAGPVHPQQPCAQHLPTHGTDVVTSPSLWTGTRPSAGPPPASLPLPSPAAGKHSNPQHSTHRVAQLLGCGLHHLRKGLQHAQRLTDQHLQHATFRIRAQPAPSVSTAVLEIWVKQHTGQAGGSGQWWSIRIRPYTERAVAAIGNSAACCRWPDRQECQLGGQVVQ